jgi:hypothetical protein
MNLTEVGYKGGTRMGLGRDHIQWRALVKAAQILLIVIYELITTRALSSGI